MWRVMVGRRNDDVAVARAVAVVVVVIVPVGDTSNHGGGIAGGDFISNGSFRVLVVVI